MHFTIKDYNGVIMVTPGRSMTHDDLVLLRTRLWDQISDQNTSVVLDLKDTPSIDTSFISFFIELKKKLNGNLALAHASDIVKEILAMTRLSEEIILCDSLEAA